MPRLKLSTGEFTFLDSEDYLKFCKYSWYGHKNGKTTYVERMKCSKGKRISIKLHRVILKAPPGVEVDHINRNGLDNRKCNLRLASRIENCRNLSKRSGGSSKYKGVDWRAAHKKFRARITVNKRLIELGYFESAKKAALAYDRAAVKYFGVFALTNKMLGILK